MSSNNKYATVPKSKLFHQLNTTLISIILGHNSDWEGVAEKAATMYLGRRTACSASEKVAWLCIASTIAWRERCNHCLACTLDPSALGVVLLSHETKNWWHQPYAKRFQTKKIVNLKIFIQIKLRLHHYLCYDKIFKTRPHLLCLHDIF